MKNIFFLILIYIITRIIFLIFQPVYFDSFEYVDRLQNVSWNQIIPVIQSTHHPIHTLYVGMAAILRVSTGFPPAFIYTSMSFVFGGIAVWLWYICLIHIYRKKTFAFWGTLVFVLFPSFLRISTNILYESMLLAFQAGTMAALLCFLDTGKKRYWISAVLCFAAAQLVFVGNIFSVLPIAVLCVIHKPNKKQWIAAWIVSSVVLAFCVDYGILGFLILMEKYLSHSGDVISPQGGIFIVLVRIIRNCITLTSILVHPFVALLSVYAIWAIRKQKQIFLTALVFIAASFLMMQYSHGGYFGRIGILIVFPVSMILGSFFGDRQKFGIIICALLWVNICLLGWEQRQVPYIHALSSWEQSVVIPQGQRMLFVVTPFTRFAYGKTTQNIFVIGDDSEKDAVPLLERMKDILKSNGRVFVDSSVMTYPYDKPDGWGYHRLFGQNKQGFFSEWFPEHCAFDAISQQKSLPPFAVYEVTACDK
jgi:hypothetical protein